MSSDKKIPYVSQWASYTADNRPLTRTIKTSKESALERAATANKQWRISMAAKKKAETSKTASKAGASEGLLKRYWGNVSGRRYKGLEAEEHDLMREANKAWAKTPKTDALDAKLKRISEEAYAAGEAQVRARIGTAAVAIPSTIAAGALVHHRRKKKKKAELRKKRLTNEFRSQSGRLVHDFAPGVSFSMPEGPRADAYRKQVMGEKTAQVIPLLVGENAPTLQLPADPMVVGFDEELESILGYWEHWGKTAARKDETKLPDPVQAINPPKGLPTPPKSERLKLPKIHASLKVRPAWKADNLMKA